jgi:predicted N-acyltransferase
MTETLTIKVFRDISNIGQEAIDTLVDDGFFTYGWLKTLELSKHTNLNPFYITAFNDDQLVAFTPCFHDLADGFFRFSPRLGQFLRKLLNLRSRFKIGKNHFLICYSPSCYRSKIFTRKNMDKTNLTKTLLAEIDDVCKKEKILFSSFLFVSEFDQNLSKQLRNSGYHQFLRTKSTFYIPIRWQNFEDYLLSLKYDVRKEVRRQLRRCRENGVTIDETTEFKDLSQVLSELSSNLFAKYNKKSLYDSRFYEILNDLYIKGNAKLFIAKKKGTVVGFSLTLRHKGTLDAFNLGFNYKLQKKSDFTYFNVAYYYPIKWAIQEGIKKIYYRYTNDKVKARRGCKPERSSTFIKCHNRYINFLISNFLKIRNRIKKLSK